MASFFTNFIDKVTPWDRKGEVQRRQEKKRPEPTIIRPTPNPGIRTNANSVVDVIGGAREQKPKVQSQMGTLNMISTPTKRQSPNMDAIAGKTVSNKVSVPKPKPTTDSMTAIRNMPAPQPINVGKPQQSPSMRMIAQGGVKPKDISKPLNEAAGKSRLSSQDYLEATATGAARTGVDIVKGGWDLATLPQKAAGLGINKVTGDRYKDNVDLLTGRRLANTVSGWFNKPNKKIAEFRDKGKSGKALEEMRNADSTAYLLGNLLTAVSPSSTAKFDKASKITSGTREIPRIVTAPKDIKNLVTKIACWGLIGCILACDIFHRKIIDTILTSIFHRVTTINDCHAPIFKTAVFNRFSVAILNKSARTLDTVRFNACSIIFK